VGPSGKENRRSGFALPEPARDRLNAHKVHVCVVYVCAV